MVQCLPTDPLRAGLNAENVLRYMYVYVTIKYLSFVFLFFFLLSFFCYLYIYCSHLFVVLFFLFIYIFIVLNQTVSSFKLLKAAFKSNIKINIKTRFS